MYFLLITKHILLINHKCVYLYQYKSPCSETISFAPPAMPTWVDEVNDDSGSDIRKNMNKTTGIKYLIKGVSDAYKDCTNLATIDFRIKNN